MAIGLLLVEYPGALLTVHSGLETTRSRQVSRLDSQWLRNDCKQHLLWSFKIGFTVVEECFKVATFLVKFQDWIESLSRVLE